MIPELCGANFLPSADAGEALPPQPPEKIKMIAGIYLACMAGAAIIIAVGVDSMKRYSSVRSNAQKGLSGFGLLVVTVKLMKEPDQIMLIFINTFVGFQQAFFGADFTAAYVSCAVGTGTVGFVMMTFGLSDAIGCLVTGYLAKNTGRVPMIMSAAVIHTGLMSTLLFWKPHSGESYVLYIFAIIWGLSDSIWIVQINSYYGTLFRGREEAAFSNFRLWESVGYIIAYVLSPYFRTRAKIYVMFTMMIVGVILYLIVEYKDRKAKKKSDVKNEETYKEGWDNIAFQHVE